ncbi:MAG: ATP phosphoribosyltransferase [Armatimonadetes bacterium]|nr:ATP phosphoribosyltransferase [Armatimonadota bacterium]
MKLRIGIPKGSLQEATFAMFRKAGYHFLVDSRSYLPTVDDDDLEALLIRPQEIPRYVQDGILDGGLTGYDWIVDNGVDVVEVANLTYSKQTQRPVKIVLAVQKGSPIRGVKDLRGKRIATEYVRLTQRWLEENGVHAAVEFSWGACEVKVPELVDAIVVNTETGSSIRAHGLEIVELLLESTTRLIANRHAWEDAWKRGKIENMALLLRGALQAEGMVGLKMNVAAADLEAVLGTLPALRRPTIAPLSDSEWLAVETVLEERTARDLIPKLKRAGAEGIVEYPLNKVVY